MNRAFLIALMTTGQLVLAAQGETRLAIVVGSNEGLADDERLRFAESDAARFHDVLLQLGGVEARGMFFSQGRDARDVLAQVRAARAVAEKLATPRTSVTLIFYFSGHGDEEALHLSGGRLLLSELRAELDAVPARLRITFLDSCRTSASAKGVRRSSDFLLAAPARGPSGTVEMRASSSGEPAQESSELAGALFTHFIASAMRGAADFDNDGQVTLAETYTYAFRRTLMRSGQGGAFQRPTLGSDLEGAGEVVLTRLARASSTLELPHTAGDRYLVFAVPSGSVVAEVSSPTERTVALPAGRFVVQRARGGRFAVSSVDLSLGGTQTLLDSDFDEIARGGMAPRGTTELRPWQIVASGGGEWATGGAEVGATAARAAASLTRSVGDILLSSEIAWSYGPVETAGFTGSQWGFGLAPMFGTGWTWTHVNLSMRVGVDVRVLHQTLRLKQDVVYPWLPGEEERWYPTAGPRAGAQLGIPVGRHLSIELAAFASVLFRREVSEWTDTQVRARPFGSLQLGVGYRP